MEKAITDQPKLFKDEMAAKARHQRLREPHIKELTEFVDKLKSEYGQSYKIPYFDPSDGGVNAECLFLLEAPGRNAVKSDFISRDNNDETAKNFFLINKEAGLPREQTVSWNIVPWYIGNNDNKKISAAKAEEVRTGTLNLLDLLKLLPKLRAVVFVGRKALKAKAAVKCSGLDKLELFESPHPSPLFVNHDKNHDNPVNRNKILNVLKEVSHFLKTNIHG